MIPNVLDHETTVALAVLDIGEKAVEQIDDGTLYNFPNYSSRDELQRLIEPMSGKKLLRYHRALHRLAGVRPQDSQTDWLRAHYKPKVEIMANAILEAYKGGK